MDRPPGRTAARCLNRDLLNLEIAAGLWVGTPFCEQSAVRGAGVCCHAVILETYFDAGWLERFAYPVAPLRSGRRMAVQFFAGNRHFMPVNLDEFRPGDTLQFRLGPAAHFMLVLSNGYFHCAENVGTRIANCIQPNWLKRLTHVWRLKPLP
jgi:hypothetical protein